MDFTYLDNAATTKPCAAATEATLSAMQSVWGNPSSLHDFGLQAEQLVSSARQTIANRLECDPNEIYFTSGGTEANNTAVFGAAEALSRRGKRIVTTAVEHSSVQAATDLLEQRGFEVVRLKPNAQGQISADAVFEAVTKDTVLVTMMLVNNETGAIFPVAAAKEALLQAGSPGLVHCDAVQAFGKTRFTPTELGADLVSISSHKVHGPKGVGALYKARKARILPLLYGGEQQSRLRPGTEAVPLIAGFGAAAQEPFDFADTTVAQLNAYARQRLATLPQVQMNIPEGGSPYILNFSVLGYRSETLLHFLAARGIYVSSGSACAKGKPSHVLTAMGLPQNRADSALRLSFCRHNTQKDIDALVAALQVATTTLRAKG